MPTVSVGRDRLFSALGRTYSQEEFEDLCFSFGIELDDVTTEKAIIRKEKHLGEEQADEDEEIIYKIEVPANRYDLLCLEGLSQALRIFNKQDEIPTYTVAEINKESMIKMHVKPETSLIRPYVVCAVLRDITFDEASYNSFIDLQDKLHHNICRQYSNLDECSITLSSLLPRREKLPCVMLTAPSVLGEGH
uniref:PhenylalaninetRNA ligase beta subunit cytoplasmic n=1 Tax=Rhizophora mucronata TaxID=61149 RepID=A0A2P2MTQ4_RHIMU